MACLTANESMIVGVDPSDSLGRPTILDSIVEDTGVVFSLVFGLEEDCESTELDCFLGIDFQRQDGASERDE